MDREGVENLISFLELIDKFKTIKRRTHISIFTKEIMDDHVHLFVNCPSEFSVRKLLQILKGGTSHFIRNKHPYSKKI